MIRRLVDAATMVAMLLPGLLFANAVLEVGDVAFDLVTVGFPEPLPVFRPIVEGDPVPEGFPDTTPDLQAGDVLRILANSIARTASLGVLAGATTAILARSLRRRREWIGVALSVSAALIGAAIALVELRPPRDHWREILLIVPAEVRWPLTVFQMNLELVFLALSIGIGLVIGVLVRRRLEGSGGASNARPAGWRRSSLVAAIVAVAGLIAGLILADLIAQAGQVMPRLPVPLDDAREWPSLNRAALVVSAGLGGWLAATISVGLARLIAPAANLELIASIIIVGAGALVVFSVALQTVTYGADAFVGGHDGLGTATAGVAWGHRPVLRIIRFLVLASVAFAIARADVPSSAAGADLRA